MSLLRYEVRAAPTTPLLTGTALALAITLAPVFSGVELEPGVGATLLRIATVAVIGGLVFIQDDQAATGIEVSPLSRWQRRALRGGLGLAVAALVWGSCAGVLAWVVRTRTGGYLPVQDVAVEACSLAVACAALMIVGLRRSEGTAAGVVVAPGLMVIVLVLVALPDAAAFYVDPSSDAWGAAQYRWRWFGLVSCVVCAMQVLQGRRKSRTLSGAPARNFT